MEKFVTPYSKLKNPTGLLKDLYGLAFVKILSQQISNRTDQFDGARFVKDFKKGSPLLEMKARLHLISDLLNNYLNLTYKEKLNLFQDMLGPEWPFEEGTYRYGFHLYPISQYVENNAQEDLKASMEFIKDMTKRYTGEFAVRAVANADQKLALKFMREWSKDENFHVRRLSSEGLRAKLPWGKKINWVNETPEKTLPIYNRLKDDKSLYVRRSVANSMGDLIKINEDLAFITLNSWFNKRNVSQNVLWVIKHAIRHPVKKKNQKFIDLKVRVNSKQKT